MDTVLLLVCTDLFPDNTHQQSVLHPPFLPMVAQESRSNCWSAYHMPIRDDRGFPGFCGFMPWRDGFAFPARRRPAGPSHATALDPVAGNGKPSHSVARNAVPPSGSPKRRRRRTPPSQSVEALRHLLRGHWVAYHAAHRASIVCGAAPPRYWLGTKPHMLCQPRKSPREAHSFQTMTRRAFTRCQPRCV